MLANSAAAVSQARAEGMAIPAFFSLQNDPGNPDPLKRHGHDDWINLLGGGAVARIVVMDMSVLGPGSGVDDCTQTPARMIGCLHANGALVLGYVDTDFGCRGEAEVLGASGDPNNAGAGDWLPGFDLDGIFLDNVAISEDAAKQGCFDLAKYRRIFSSIHAIALNHPAPDPCGGITCLMTNSSQYPIDDVLDSGSPTTSANFSTTYERQVSSKQSNAVCGGTDQQGYFGVTADDPRGFCPNRGRQGDPTLCGTTMQPPNWYFDALASRTAHVLRQDPVTQPFHTIHEIVAQSQTYDAGFIYVSDQLCNLQNGSQYGHLTSFYPDLLAELGAHLTISNGGGGTVTAPGNGIDCGTKCTNLVSRNDPVDLVAQPDSTHTFGGFSVGGSPICTGTGTHCTVTLSTDTTVTVTFGSGQPPPGGTLGLTKSGNGSGTVTSDPAGISCGSGCSTQSAGFAGNSQVVLTATADTGSSFDHFAVAGAGNCGSPCSVTVPSGSSVAVTATFNQDTTLTVTRSGSGTGVVTSTDGVIDCGPTCNAAYPPTAMVTLTATPDSGSAFNGWTGGGCTGTGDCTVSMSTSLSVDADFTQAIQPVCRPPQLPGCCPGDPCRPSGSDCLDVICPSND
jgi:hypothetical protein